MENSFRKISILSIIVIILSGFVAFTAYFARITSDNKIEISELSQSTPIPVQAEVQSVKTEVILLGDIMLGRKVMITSLDKNDPVYPFRRVADRLKEADLVFANLENPIIEGCPRHVGGFTFCADPRQVEGLNFAGIDIVTLANNHSMNYGREGFDETIQILNRSGISTVGDNNLVIKEINNTKFGFLGFDFLSSEPAASDFQLVANSDSQVDVLIVGVHWGVEYVDIANKYQREWARMLVENGADVVAGHHPHWMQNYEKIEGKPVYYSLGNFIFDQMWSEETKKGMAVKLTFQDGVLMKEDIYNTYMPDWAVTEFID